MAAAWGLEKLGLSFVDPDKFTDHGFSLIGAGLDDGKIGLPYMKCYIDTFRLWCQGINLGTPVLSEFHTDVQPASDCGDQGNLSICQKRSNINALILATVE